MARQPLGQNFLADTGWRARILRALNVQAGDLWVEIGAGHGEMTAELARQGARVLAVELDAKLLPQLQALARALPEITVVAGDILRLDIGSLSPSLPLKVYGSLPYYIASPILHKLFQQVAHIAEIFVVVQLEVAARLVARPRCREYGYLSVLAQYYTWPEILLRIPPGAFRPKPKITSALLSLHPIAHKERLALKSDDEFLEFAKTCFAQKRKTLLNNLKARLSLQRAKALLVAAGVPPDARAEQLSVARLADLFRAL